MSNGSLQYNLEKTLVREGLIFLIGWACHPHKAIHRIQLVLETVSGDVKRVDAELGYLRDDVAAQFSDIPWARNAGFIAYAGWGVTQLKSAHIEFIFDAWAAEQVKLLPPQRSRLGLRSKLKNARLMWAKGSQAVRHHGLLGALEKVRGFIQRRATEDASALAATVAAVAGRSVVWIVDHDMGGGANLYRQQYVENCIREGAVVIVLGFQVASLGYFLQFHHPNGVDRHAVGLLSEVRKIALQLNIVRLVYNCAVSFRDPLEVCQFLIDLRTDTQCELLVLIHDYFPICPSHVLLNADGRFCGLPDRQTCNACLTSHPGGFVSMASVRDMEVWRRAWGALIGAADDVQVFSPSSMKLLAQAYPGVNQATWQMLPHGLISQPPVLQLKAGRGLHIGVVGTLGVHKGAKIVAKLAQEISTAQLNIPITIFGTIQTSEALPGVKLTGSYLPENLPTLIERSGANVFLFASIWPETFSYVTHELCAMDVPVVCFDKGAQADLVRSYPKGKVLPLAEPSTLIAELTKFWEVCYPHGTV